MIIAFQQFTYQEDLRGWDIARIYRLFHKLAPDSKLDIKFNEMFGIHLKEFLELSTFLLIWSMKPDRGNLFTLENVFGNTSYERALINSYLDAISASSETTTLFLSNRKHGLKNPAFQLYEKSPLSRFPLLKLSDRRFILFSRHILKQTLTDLLYDLFKSEIGSNFCEYFGRIIEGYIENALIENDALFYDEKSLRKSFPDSMITDFVLPLATCTVLIEVKSVEIRPLVRVVPTNEALEKELKESVIKAVVQGFTTAYNLSRGNDSLTIENRTSFFLFIVTYRNMYLGHGRAVWDEFLSQAVQPTIVEKNISLELLPPEHIIIMSLEEFDFLMAVLRTTKVELSKILSEVVSDNSKPETQKLNFIQHFWKYVPASLDLPYLNNDFNELFETIKERFINRA